MSSIFSQKNVRKHIKETPCRKHRDMLAVFLESIRLQLQSSHILFSWHQGRLSIANAVLHISWRLSVVAERFGQSRPLTGVNIWCLEFEHFRTISATVFFSDFHDVRLTCTSNTQGDGKSWTFKFDVCCAKHDPADPVNWHNIYVSNTSSWKHWIVWKRLCEQPRRFPHDSTQLQASTITSYHIIVI